MGSFKDVVGHKDIINYIRNAVTENKVSHAYILNGERGSGKKMLANLFATTLLCEEQGPDPCNACHSCHQAESGNHPDIIRVTHEKPNTISVDDIRRQVNEDIQIKPYQGPYKIYIIAEADLMTVQAQNALLKTIEEPPAYAVIFLLTENAEALLPTITSRCVMLKLRNIKEEGVTFASHIDGRRIFMGPEESMRIQSNLGSDIAMAFDECIENPATYEYVKPSCERTLRWLERCKAEHDRLNGLPDTVNPRQMLFGINQGGTYSDLRIWHMKEIAKLDCDGYAIGGLAVGEPTQTMYDIIEAVEPLCLWTSPGISWAWGPPATSSRGWPGA